MNICILSELFYPYVLGGAERRYMEIAKRLSKKHEITVYSLRLHGFPKTEIWENITIKRVGMEHPLNKRFLQALATYASPLLRCMKSEYDVIDMNQGIAMYASIFSPATHRPMIATFHDIYADAWKKYYPGFYSFVGKVMEYGWSMLAFDSVIANSFQTKEKLEQLGIKNATVINSGIDLKFINSIRSKKTNSIVYVGRLVDYKHVDELIIAFKGIEKQYPNTTLKIIGSGYDEQRLKNIAANDKRIKFFGYVSEKDKIRHIKSASLLVNPSEVEGLGLILLEAMACRTPVMAKALSCYKDFAIAGKNAFITNKITAKSILKILDNKKLQNNLSAEGQATAKNFTWDKTAERVERIYHNRSFNTV